MVVAADRPPAELEILDERVRSRLAGGLVVEMAPLDEPLRVAILETRIAAAAQRTTRASRSARRSSTTSPAVITPTAATSKAR